MHFLLDHVGMLTERALVAMHTVYEALKLSTLSWPLVEPLGKLLTAVASPYKSDIDDSVAKAFGFALVAVFFFALVIKVHVLTESLYADMAQQQWDEFSFNIVVVSACLTIAVALALIVTVLVALQQFVHAARTPIVKLRSTSGRPALTVDRGITWHLFLSQCALPPLESSAY